MIWSTISKSNALFTNFFDERYLNKKKSAEEMEQQFQKTSSVDYSLKDGETIVLQFKSKVGWFSLRWYLLPHIGCFIVINLIFTRSFLLPTEKH